MASGRISIEIDRLLNAYVKRMNISRSEAVRFALENLLRHDAPGEVE